MRRRYYGTSAGYRDENKKFKISSRFFIGSLLFFFFGIFVIAALYFLVRGDIFRVREIKVSGSRIFGPEEIIKIIIPHAIPDYPWRALLSPNHMLFWQFAENRKINSRIVPIFESVSAKPDWGGRVVKIDIKERSIFGIWCGNGNIIGGAQSEKQNEECFAFDREGVIFSRAPQAEGSLFFLIRNENPFSGFLGGNILPRRDWMRNVFDAVSVINDHNRNANLAIIKNYAVEEWEVRLWDGPRLLFSLNFIPQNLSGLLQNLDKKFDLDKLEYIDFRVQNRIFYK